MLSYAKVIHEDPKRRGLLYLGTENAIYVSFNDGDHWQPLQNDLPHAPVSGIVVQEHFDDLVISTYGRGFCILDDISAPLQQLTPAVLAADAHLFPPRAAYRFRPITAPSTTYDDPTSGEIPKYGASINYFLKGAPSGPVSVTILDGKNQVVGDHSRHGPRRAQPRLLGPARRADRRGAAARQPAPRAAAAVPARYRRHEGGAGYGHGSPC